MTVSGIWTQNQAGWQLREPERFSDEATLHKLIEETPEMLPLAGAPALLMLGSEVSLGSGYADLVGVESSGRPVIIEIKLAKSPEARRAVVAQILAYAANLHGMTREQLEYRFISELKRRGHESIVDAMRSLQEEAFEDEEFNAALDEHLREGRFRLVFVLDDVPTQLRTLVAYLEHVTDKLIIDLVAVHSFDVEGTTVVLPQPVVPERHEVTVEEKRRGKSSTVYQGSERFEQSISQAPSESQESLTLMLEWARELEEKGWAQLTTSEGKGAKRFTLRPLLVGENVGLVTIWNDGGAYLGFWQSVFKKNAPAYIKRIEELAGCKIGQGNTIPNVNDELLKVLTEAYKHTASRA
ncbi:MAG: hypothetical protein OXG89_07015 [bacterium]|nr:hypothetical protein [bacterium]MDE2715674.1 hypothetical protein [Chloroflexota bacterium]